MTGTSGLYAALVDHFKPHRAEALYRTQVNGICLVTGVLSTYLLPAVPALHKAISVVRGYPEAEHGYGEGMYRWFCISGEVWSPFAVFHRLLFWFVEVVALALFFVNFLHGIYALKYPRDSLPPIASPNRPKGIRKVSLTPQRPFRVLSPQVTQFVFGTFVRCGGFADAQAFSFLF